jgi:hypothetical protein
MKNLIIISLLIVSINKSYSQTYEIRRVDDYNPTSTVETARYIGRMQEKIQLRYDVNYEKFSRKVRGIEKIIEKIIQLHKNGDIELKRERLLYLKEYYNKLEKIKNVDFSDNSSLNIILNYLDEIENVIYKWL